MKDLILFVRQNGFIYYQIYDSELKRYSSAKSTKTKNLIHARVIANKQKTLYLHAETQDQLFTEYLEAFWQLDSSYVKQQNITRQHTLSVTYIKTNSHIVRVHMIPFFNDMMLSEVRLHHLESLQRELIAKGLSPKSCNNYLNVIVKALKEAVRLGVLKNDPSLWDEKVVDTM